MKLAFVMSDLPYPPLGGWRTRAYALLKNLADRHRITLIAFDRQPENSGRFTELKKICQDVIRVPLANHQLSRNKRKYQILSLLYNRPYQYFSLFSPEMQRTIDRHLQGQGFDIIQVEAAQMGYYKFPENVRCVLDQHNVEHELMYRTYLESSDSLRKLYSFMEWRKFARDEINICRKFHTILTTSEHDKMVLRENLREDKLFIIPNGVDSGFFESLNEDSSENTLLFTGTIDYFPNTDGLRYFIEKTLPLIRSRVSGVKLYIVGINPPPIIQRYASDPNIIVTGYVDDIREYFKKATAVIVPLRVGGGTRLKILEAMAMRKPVVATSVGAEGLDVVDGKNILIADQPAALSEAVVTLLRDKTLRMRLAEGGRQLVEERYDWKLITKQLEQVYEQILEN